MNLGFWHNNNRGIVVEISRINYLKKGGSHSKDSGTIENMTSTSSSEIFGAKANYLLSGLELITFKYFATLRSKKNLKAHHLHCSVVGVNIDEASGVLPLPHSEFAH